MKFLLFPKTEIQFEDIIRQARQTTSLCTEIQFRSAASFKQNGRYVIFPQEKLILQSLVNRWNSFCEEYPLCDPDALCMLESGIYIRDYALKSVRYHLKNVYIPAFVGKVTLDSRLPVPLAELWHAILLWADYSGIGIKTALGMGGANVRFL